MRRYLHIVFFRWENCAFLFIGVWFRFFLFSIVAIFPIYTTSLVKDSVFACSVLLFTLEMALVLFSKLKLSKVDKFLFMASSVLVVLLRSNGSLIVLTVSIAALSAFLYCVFAQKKESVIKSWKAILVGTLAGIVASLCYFFAVLPAMSLESDSAKASLSIPFQQTARYLVYYPEDITEAESEVITNVLDYDRLTELYVPYLSDPVKATFHGSPDDLRKYFTVWAAQFARHPDVYVDAFAEQSYGFFFPEAVAIFYYNKSNNATESNDVVLFDESALQRSSAALVGDYLELNYRFPLTAPFNNVGINSLLLIYLLFWTVSEREHKLLFLLIPSLVTLVVCMLGPTYFHNGVRYALPIIYTNILLVGIALSSSRLHLPQSR